MAGDEEAWAAWLRAANRGDERSYRRFLEALAGFLRAVARRQCSQAGLPAADAEDVLQDTLLAIHLKRHTWDEGQPVLPWVRAIARNKVIDTLRRKGRRVHMPIEDFAEILPSPEPEYAQSADERARVLDALNGRQRDVIESVSVNGASIRETAARLGISEGAVRVALHRGLKTLGAIFGKDN